MGKTPRDTEETGESGKFPKKRGSVAASKLLKCPQKKKQKRRKREGKKG